MSRSFELRASGLIIGAVILAGLTAQALLGNYTYFGSTAASLPIGTAWMAVPLCGVIGGLSGALFSRILVAIPDLLPVRLARVIRTWPIAFPVTCGFGVALCGLASDGAIHGTGYEYARAVLHHTGTLRASSLIEPVAAAGPFCFLFPARSRTRSGVLVF
jgi:hypothetical protein